MPRDNGPTLPDHVGVLVVGAGLLVVHWILRARTIDSVWASMRWWTRALVLAAMWVAIVLQGTAGGVDHEFIYFQF